MPLLTVRDAVLRGQALHRPQEGQQMGQQAGHLLTQKWKLSGEPPLADWREQLGIVPARP